MAEQSQQDLLQELKEALSGTWDDVAAATKITERALKSYRLPTSSKGYRGMDNFVRKAVEDALAAVRKKQAKNA
jgi:cation transport regulator ChaB